VAAWRSPALGTSSDQSGPQSVEKVKEDVMSWQHRDESSGCVLVASHRPQQQPGGEAARVPCRGSGTAWRVLLLESARIRPPPLPGLVDRAHPAHTLAFPHLLLLRPCRHHHPRRCQRSCKSPTGWTSLRLPPSRSCRHRTRTGTTSARVRHGWWWYSRSCMCCVPLRRHARARQS
jgi:hypothetical protein